MNGLFRQNTTRKGILTNLLIAFLALAVNGIGVYLTIRAGIGSAPWDVLNLGVSRTFGILYGNVSIIISIAVLCVDILLREPIGLSMIIDAFTVGKTVDLLNYLSLVPQPRSLAGSILMMVVGLLVIGYTQYYYMQAALGCGPRDTLLVGLAKRLKKIPIGAVGILIMGTVTLTGWLLGGPVGIGTLMCAFGCGPIMQMMFALFHGDARAIRHQNLKESWRVLCGRAKRVRQFHKQ